MKALGIILLVLGILSLIGGITHPSNSETFVVAGGYVLKFGLIIGGIVLISKSDNKTNDR
jgi:hypothetical protein